jgi:HEAT repeat protein
MAKRPTLEQRLAELDALRDAPKSEESLQALRHALELKNSFIVARAAELAGEFESCDLSDALVSAFNRLIEKDYEKDKGCRAKAAVAEALQLIGAPEDNVYLRGARHVQMEPVWGGRTDTAGALRSASAIGLVRMNHTESLLVLADLLADPLAPVRADAARTLAYRGATDGLPLLRIRVQIGDEDSDVITECVLAMLQLDARVSMDLVRSMYHGPDPIRSDSAVLALGQSRLPEAFDLLKDWWMDCGDQEMRKTLLLSIAMLRRDEATAFLVTTISQDRQADARDAVDALAIYRHDESIKKQVIAAAESSEGKELFHYMEKAFGQPHDRTL